MKPADTLPPPPQNYFVAPDCSQYYGQKLATQVPGTSTAIPPVNGKAQPWTNCGYTPAQIRGAYHVGTSGETGKGVTVAVVDAYASPTMLADANQYAKVTGDKPFAAGQYNAGAARRQDRLDQHRHRHGLRRVRAGTARSRWTWNPCTAWHRTPTSHTSAR